MIYLILIQLSLCWSHPLQQKGSRVDFIENLDRLTSISKEPFEHIQKPSNLGDNFEAITISKDHLEDKRRKRQDDDETSSSSTFEPMEPIEAPPTSSTDSGKASGPSSKIAWLYLMIPIACLFLFIVFTMPLVKTTAPPSPPPVEPSIASDPGLISPSGGMGLAGAGPPGGPASAEAMKTVSEPKLAMPPHPPLPQSGLAPRAPAPAIRPPAPSAPGPTPARPSKSVAKVITGKRKGPTPKT